jgi:hypothetical protein
MKLGNLIDTLELFAPDVEIVLDDGTVPIGLCSWRGSYGELSIDSRTGRDARTVAEMLRESRAADGGAFTGYKGGEYKMDRETPVWADPWGECDYRVPRGLAVVGGRVEIITANVGDYR